MDINKLKKDFENTVLKTARDSNQLMRLTKILGTKYSISTACIISSLFIFFSGNFIINLFISIYSRKNPFTLKNFLFIDFKFIFTFRFFLYVYLILIIVISLNNMRIIYLLKTNMEDQNVNQKGGSRWTTLDEIKQEFKEIDDSKTPFPGAGGIPVCRIGDKLYIDDSNTNTLHVGITRSGKDEMFAMPEIDIYSRSEEKPSIVDLDLKTEMTKMSYMTLINRGYDVQVLNIENPEYGFLYNPLSLITKAFKDGDIPQAELLCNSFAYSIYSSPDSSAGDQNAEFFVSNATSAVAAAILAHISDCLDDDKRQNAKYLLRWRKYQEQFLQLTQEKQLEIRKIFKKLRSINLSTEEYFTLLELPDDEEKFIKLPQKKQQEASIIFKKLGDQDSNTENYITLIAIPDDEEFIPSTKNEECINLYSVIYTFQELARDYINEKLTKLDIYFQSRPAFDRPKSLYASVEVAGDRTKGSVFSQALTKLAFYTFDDIAKLTSKSTFELSNLGFGDKPVALFIAVPFYDRSKDSIVSTMISQIWSANSRMAAQTTKSLKCKRKIIYHLNEIGNYPAIKDFDTMTTIGLGTNQIFNLFLQSYNQLDVTYGKKANTIKDNCGNHIYIQTASLDTAEYFSKLIGNKTITNITRSGTKLSLKKTITELYEEKPLLNPNELMELLPGENVIKRVMKRTDLNGKKVKPRPIFNNIESGTSFKYRYEYLADDFPNAEEIDFKDLPIIKKDFDNMDMENIVYDFNISFCKYGYEKISEKLMSGEEVTDDESNDYRQFKEMFKYDTSISQLPNISILEKQLMELGIKTNKKTTIADLLDKVFHADIPKKAKNKIFDSINEFYLNSMEKDPPPVSGSDYVKFYEMIEDDM